MNRALSFIILALSLVGCATVERTTMGQPGLSGTRKAQYGFGVVDLGYDGDYVRSFYIIDPRTQVCVLARRTSGAGEWGVHVSCAKLKATVPEAAEFVTWDTTSSAP